MLSELDIQLQAILGRLTAPGSPFETGHIDLNGRRLPLFRNAPPTLPALFERYCNEQRDAEFLIDGTVRLTFGDVYALAQRTATGLITRHGVRRGDRVGIAAANSANWVIVYMGVLMAGGCATLLNGWWSGEELAEAIKLARCDLVLADSERAARLEGHDTGGQVVTFASGEPAAGLRPLLGPGSDPAIPPELTGEDLATLIYTSGSTGLSKAAVSNHRAVVQASMNIAVQALMLKLQLDEAGSSAEGQPASLLSVPLFHVTGEVAVLLKSFLIGCKLVIMPKWNASEAMRLIEQERVTFFTGVPLMSHEVATHPDRGEYDLTSCSYFVAGGSAQPAEHLSTLRQSMRHALPLQGYGLTETNSVGCTNFTDNYVAKPDSTGPASRPLVEIAILGPTGETLPAGMTGEVAIRSICNFTGYWNDPEATAAAIRPDGFFLTGDLGRLDHEGYLYIVDRKKDVIIRGGENIAAVEVERAIYSHPHIAEVSVFGLPDKRYGEVPVAVYHTKAGQSLDARELQRHLAERIAAFKIPVQFWDLQQALPRLGAEKVDKRALKDRYGGEWTRSGR